MLCEFSYIILQIFSFISLEKCLSTSINIFRIFEPVLASERARKQHLMDCASCATPKFGRARGHVPKIGPSD
jgi:hypothetical protein